MVLPFLSLASAKQRLSVSGFIPLRVPVYSFPFVVVTVTVLSSRAAISPKNFLWATDNFSPFVYFVVVVKRLFCCFALFIF
jgi:hypothetical protein